MPPPPGRFLSFDAVAAEYDATRPVPPEAAVAVARLCASAASLDGGGLFLDAGIGTGRFAAPLAALYPGQIVGIDVSAAMMRLARGKTLSRALLLAQGDLQRLPVRTGVFDGILAVHVLHLMEGWKRVLEEMRRALVPRRGVMLLGTEQGGHSVIVDHYYVRARAAGLLSPSLGAPAHARLLALLRRGGAQTDALGAPALTWQREVSVAQTLDGLQRRLYSQMWPVPASAHEALMRDAAAFAAQHVGGPARTEVLQTRFALAAVRWPEPR